MHIKSVQSQVADLKDIVRLQNEQILFLETRVNELFALIKTIQELPRPRSSSEKVG